MIILYDMEENLTPQEETIIPQEDLDFLDSVMEEQHKEIPENSKTLLLDESTSRFSGAVWYEKIQEKKVILAGLGGIGSWVALLLARLNIKGLVLYDPDLVERVNMAGQLYGRYDVGSYKVGAITAMISTFAEYYRYTTFGERFTSNSLTSNIMICGFDNMAARKVFFERWLDHVNSNPTEKSTCLFIDGRLNAEEFQVLAVKGDDNDAIEKYRTEWLFDDSEVEEATCSYKQTTFMANMIASVIVNIFVNFVANECEPIYPRDVPFFTSYSADTMFTKIVL